MSTSRYQSFIDRQFDQSILPVLTEYVRIPNKSPAFAPDWETLGHMQRAVELLAGWCRAQPIPGLRVEVRQLPGRTPLLVCDIPGTLPETVLLYGHLDKQPEFTGWAPGLAPWEPVIRDGRLYGRGGADDGYAVFGSLSAVMALQAAKVPLPRCIVLIEASEESGSVDLPAHLDALGSGFSEPALVICLDAESSNYEQLWCTTSLRGVAAGTLRIRMLREGVHSGLGTGIAATPFMVLRQLLARLEDERSGDITLEALRVETPADRRAQIERAARILGDGVAAKLPFVAGARPLSTSAATLLERNTWRATLAVTGADGLPPIANAGNVLLPEIAVKLSIRLPPTVDAEAATRAVRATLEADPPFGAEVRFEGGGGMAGWNAPSFAPWLETAMQRASQTVFQRDVVSLGGGGSIPFMGMLGARFPATQFLITGVLGPQSNAHGPNEFLDIAYTKKIIACVAEVLADFAMRHSASRAA
jgi:acetylornithine deacetylase/succinyl-diaminopimelate desuccinylase-like protein